MLAPPTAWDGVAPAAHSQPSGRAGRSGRYARSSTRPFRTVPQLRRCQVSVGSAAANASAFACPMVPYGGQVRQELLLGGSIPGRGWLLWQIEAYRPRVEPRLALLDRLVQCVMKVS